MAPYPIPFCLSAIGGNVIVNVKDSRVALNEDMARHILV